MVRAIKAAQRLGFTLDEVADLMDAARHRHGPGDGGGLRQRVEQKLIDAGCDDLIACASIPGWIGSWSGIDAGLRRGQARC